MRSASASRRAPATIPTALSAFSPRLAAMPILVPPQGELDLLRHFFVPIREMIGALERESISLSGIRDVLLPKLVSGDIRPSRDLSTEGAK